MSEPKLRTELHERGNIFEVGNAPNTILGDYAYRATQDIETLKAQLHSAEQRLNAEERAHELSIDKRDKAEDALALAYWMVTGREAIWSNLFGYDEAIHDIRAACASAEQRLNKLLSELPQAVAKEVFNQFDVAEPRGVHYANPRHVQMRILVEQCLVKLGVYKCDAALSHGEQPNG